MGGGSLRRSGRCRRAETEVREGRRRSERIENPRDHSHHTCTIPAYIIKRESQSVKVVEPHAR